MPASKRMSSSDPGDIWRREEYRIKKLYKKHSVKDLKRIMEKNGAFPERAVPTWIENLGKLDIRKNVTSEEWRKIYRHVVPRLENPARQKGDLKLKRTKKETEIIVRGRKYTWDQAWKNMKSAKAIGQLPQPEEALSPLPPDIVIRTPTLTSPPFLAVSRDDIRESSLSTIDPPANRPASGGRAIICRPLHNPTGDEAIPLVPAWAVIHYTIDIANTPRPSETYLQYFRQDSDSTFPSANLPAVHDATDHAAYRELRWNVTHQYLSAMFGHRSTALASFTSLNNNYVLLFTVIYILSNNIMGFDYDHYRFHRRSLYHDIFSKLDLVFAAVPGKYLEDLLHSRLASIRAAFEALIILSGRHKQPQAFKTLIVLGASYGWLAVSAKAHEFLIFAASMDLICSMQTLLDNGCRPDSLLSDKTYRWSTTAIVEAMKCENFRCAHLLLKHCDVNKAIQPHGFATNFDYFLLHFHGCGNIFHRGLKLFVQAGANLDANTPVFQSSRYMMLRSSHLFRHQRDRAYPKELGFSVMDYLFYFHRPLFHAFVWASAQARVGRLSRAAVLLSWQDGTQRLGEHLDSLAIRVSKERLERFLKRLLAEQFLICDLQGRKRVTDLEAVRALVNFGVSIKEVLCDFPRLLERFTELVGRDCPKHEVEAVQYLIDNGATVNGKVLSWLVRLPDTRLFDIARGGIEDTRELQIALIDAAARNDFDAVEELVQTGVNLDADIKPSANRGVHVNPGDYVILRKIAAQRRISLIANVICSWNPKVGDLPKMLDFLVSKGAPLRLSTRRTHLYHLLRYTMVRFCLFDSQSVLGIVQYIVGVGYDLSAPSCRSASLLEDCYAGFDGKKIFEYLLRNGAQLRPGSPMASWIGMNGEIGLVRKMLEAGVDLNAYDRRHHKTALQLAAEKLRTDVVELLLQEGADVNAPARGEFGRTALQGACGAEPTSLDQQQLKLRTVQILLDHGADVNAAPARTWGMTALQETARWGDIAIAKLLLSRHPMADVNAPQGQRVPDEDDWAQSAGNALEFAAQFGRIDMVKLLLSYNALSYRRGETGYDGAILLAEEEGHLAVADLIRQHTKDADRSDTRNPYLSQPPRDWREYGYKLGPEEDSEYSGEEKDPRGETDSGDDTDSEEDKDSGVWSNPANWTYEREQTDPGEEKGFTSSLVLDQLTPSEASWNLDVHDSTQPLAHDESAVSVNDNNTWGDWGDLSLAHEGELIAMGHSFQNMGFEASMDFDMCLDFDIRQSASVQYAGHWVPEHEGELSFCKFEMSHSLATPSSSQRMYTSPTAAQTDNTPTINPPTSTAPPPFDFLDPAFASMIEEAAHSVSIDDYTRPFWQHSAFLVIIGIFVGMFLPGILLASVASFGPMSLAIRCGCLGSGPTTSEFTCPSAAVTRLAILIAFVHVVVGAVCGWAGLKIVVRTRKYVHRWMEEHAVRKGGRRGRGEAFMNRARKRISEHGKEVRKLNAELARDLRWLKRHAGASGLSWGPNSHETAVTNSTSTATAVILTFGTGKAQD
ncbi:hypothetical protein J7T55_014749 [Diaporthe amygdali]|uniref:uncharacterized protein n=1 Tax=Phomopsis amygdali TaxID=1214568 RepID=UPI0022FEF48B|nr:uncharacterized protein J7T55_014749 [Diaporthe amygdali]KAJ0109947.1 hypothetical protein J7T55_014749 [Diaporthe amygdali]